MTAGRHKDGTGEAQRRVPPAVGQGDMGSIPKIDLDLHGDAIGHRQDEPQPRASKTAGERGRADRKD